MLISQSPDKEDAVIVLNVTGLVYRFLNVTELNNSLPVTITVTATDRVGQRNGNTSNLLLRTPEGKFV